MKPLFKIDFILYLCSQVLSQAGDGLYMVALTWGVLQIDKNPIGLGILGLSIGSPILLFGLLGGYIADKLNRALVAAICDLSRSIIVLFIPILNLLGVLQLWHIFIVAFAVSAFEAIFQPSIDALIPDIVDKNRLVHANSLVNATLQGAYFVSPALFGLLISVIHINGIFIFDSITYIISSISLFILYFICIQAKRNKEKDQIEMIPEKGSIIAYLSSHKWVLFILIMFGLGTLVGSGTMRVALPMFAENFSGGPDLYGYLLCMAGIGVIIGNLLLVIIKKQASIIMILSGWSVFGLLHIAFVYTRDASMMLMVFLFIGIASAVFQTNIMAYFQQQVRNDLLGKVLGIWNTLACLGSTLSSPFIAIIITLGTVKLSFLVSGIFIILLGIIGVLGLIRERR
jgi:MFS family permease